MSIYPELSKKLVDILLAEDCPVSKSPGDVGYTAPNAIKNGKTRGKLKFPKNFKVKHAFKSGAKSASKAKPIGKNFK
jgi:hypothetical protein